MGGGGIVPYCYPWPQLYAAYRITEAVFGRVQIADQPLSRFKAGREQKLERSGKA